MALPWPGVRASCHGRVTPSGSNPSRLPRSTWQSTRRPSAGRVSLFLEGESAMSKPLCVLLSVLVLVCAAGVLLTPPARAQVSLTTLGAASTQSFDTLPASGSATWTNNSTIPGWYHARTGTGHHHRGERRQQQRRQSLQLWHGDGHATGRSARSARATPRPAISSGASGCRTTPARRSPPSTSPIPASSGATARPRRRRSPSPTWSAARRSPAAWPSSSPPEWPFRASISPARSPAAPEPP